MNVLPVCCISISTAVVHQGVFDDVGQFDPQLRVCEDYDFWLRATHKYPVKLIPEYLTLKDGGRSDQLSFNTWGMDRFRVKALEKMLAADVLDSEERQKTYAVLEEKCRIFVQGAVKRGKVEEAQNYREIIRKWT